MGFVKWEDDYALGVHAIDIEHQHIIRTINHLHDALKAGKGREALSEILIALISFAQTHFEDEEYYMREFDYPGLESHRREHALFLDVVRGFQADFENNRVAMTEELVHFLSEWLEGHMRGTDRHYVECFHDHGLQ